MENASSSSSYSTIPSDSSSDSEDERLGLLSKAGAFIELFGDVRRTEEPTLLRHPDVVRIQYSNTFNNVMGIYRTLSATFTGTRTPSSPKWLLLTVFVLDQCASHYSAWKDRRDVLLVQARVQCSTQEAFMDNMVDDIKNKFSRSIVQNWLPSAADLVGPCGTYSKWRTVRWEFNTTKCFNVRHRKNFQVWHHRRELLLSAFSHTDPGLLTSHAEFNNYLSTTHGIQFSDIDERILCNEVLQYDEKNYHLWWHRSWFVHAFPFLLQPPEWTVLLGGCDAVFDRSISDRTPLRQFVVHENWINFCLEPTVPPCSLMEELAYTAGLIRSDCLNNSAWCHRHYVFEHDLINVLLRTSMQFHPQDVNAVIRELCLKEMHYALQWCVYEPCNESSFVHSRSVGAVYQAAALRIHLFGAASGAHNFLRDTGLITTAAPLSENYTQLIHRVSWGVFLETLSLFEQQMSVFRDIVSPRSEALRSSTAARDTATVQAIHECRSQFLLDNVHQVYAALYHTLFLLLELLWCCYFTEVERARLNVVLPPDIYVEGVAAVRARVAKEQDSCIRFFLDNEVEAMELARRLVEEDPIRSKYWKNEMNIVMHRDYC